MCGIAGLIGKSTDPDLSYKIATKIFSHLEMRGEHAAGFWGTNADSIIYHKEPIRSSLLVEKKIWRQVSDFNPTTLLLHARLASFGDPVINRNNHPFVSSDRETALVHNGMIPEFDWLRAKFEVLSNCDSEVLLRIIEHFGPDNALFGIMKIFSVIQEGHIAAAVARHKQGLWLFRNEYRPLWVVDLRTQLNQILFCSIPEFWREVSSLVASALLYEVQVSEVWHINENTEISRIKLGVGIDTDFQEYYPIEKKTPTVELVANVEDDAPVVVQYDKIESHLNTISELVNQLKLTTKMVQCPEKRLNLEEKLINIEKTLSSLYE